MEKEVELATGTRTKAVAKVPDAVLDEVAAKAADMYSEAQEVFADDLPKGIHGKIALIMANMPTFAPEGQNKYFKYKYWSTDQITGYFRKRFGEMGISFGVNVMEFDIREHETAKEGRSALTTLLVEFRLTDSDTGETYVGNGIGQGDDPSDKGSNKALAGATKYWLIKTFLLGGEDPEADEATDRRSEARAGGRNSTRERPASASDEQAAPVISDSNIEGIRRGGRANKATDAQIRQVRVLARDLGWSPPGIATAVGTWLNDELELPEDPAEAGAALLRYLENLDSDDIGSVVTKMTDLRDEPAEPAEGEFGPEYN